MKDKKQSKVKGFALGMALVLAMGASGTALAMGVKNNDWFKPDDQIEDDNDNAEVDPLLKGDRNFISLKMNNEALVTTSETGEKTVEKKLTAIVCPKDALNKAVDWSLEWEKAPTENADINEYLRITPESDGALTATLTAYKAFEDAFAVVKVTTREGNYSTTCMVAYDGRSESLDLVFTSSRFDGISFIKAAFVGTIEVPEKSSTLLSIDALVDDSFDLPPDTFVFEHLCDGLGFGKCWFASSHVDKFQVTQNFNFVFDLSEGVYSFYNGPNGSFRFEPDLDEFIECDVALGMIEIDAIQAIESYDWGATYVGPYIDSEGDGTADKCTFALTFISGLDEDNFDFNNLAVGLLYVNIIPETTGDTTEAA